MGALVAGSDHPCDALVAPRGRAGVIALVEWFGRERVREPTAVAFGQFARGLLPEREQPDDPAIAAAWKAGQAAIRAGSDEPWMAAVTALMRASLVRARYIPSHRDLPRGNPAIGAFWYATGAPVLIPLRTWNEVQAALSRHCGSLDSYAKRAHVQGNSNHVIRAIHDLVPTLREATQ